MTITSAFNAALSGLSATARRAEIVSSNIANASTPGYGRREVVLSSGLVGGRLPGVTISGVVRNQDLVLVGQRREAQAGLANAETAAKFFTEMEGVIGLPGESGSLHDKLAQFESALIEASSRPDSEARLQSVVSTASNVAAELNNVSSHVQDVRLNADRDIATAVDTLNTAFEQIFDLNAMIVKYEISSGEVSSLVDERSQLIDSIAEYMPIRQVPRPNGAVAIYTPGGALLVDSKPAVIGFSPAPEVTEHMTVGGGGLSGLTIDGLPVSTDSQSGPISSGKLAGLFDVRDRLAPQLQTEIDALARNLVERFEDTAVDPTLNPGDPGLFTDGGDPLDISEELGLASRISINALADPKQGGALWHVRNGLGAATIGDAGDATILNAMSTALEQPLVPNSGTFTTERSAVGLAGDILSMVSAQGYQAEARVSFNRATADALITSELSDGVDTDQEMQELLLIEQTYAANARVITTLDELIQQLLRI